MRYLKRILIFSATVVAGYFIVQVLFFGLTYKNSDGEILIGKKPGKKDLSMDGPYFFKDDKLYNVVYVKDDKADINVVEDKFADVYNSNWTCITESDNIRDTFNFKLNEQHSIDSSEYRMPGKILAISDIEGNFFALKSILVSNGVVDSSFNWIYGKNHLVLLGDFMDRGENVTQCLWLIYKLEQEAHSVGGKVHFINGNHEELNYRGNVSYVRPKYVALANELKMKHAQFFDGASLIGNWLRRKNVLVKIGDVLFCHGGISPELLRFNVTISEINSVARTHFGLSKAQLRSEGKLASFLFSTKGIMWYRGFFKSGNEYQKITLPELNKICKYFQVKRIVVGHTIQEDISGHYNGVVVGIDVVQPTRSISGVGKALLIDSNRFFKVYSNGERYLLF